MLKPYDDIDLDLEYAFGDREGKTGGGEDSAYHINLLGRHKWISYHLETVHAGADYPGYYSDLDFKSARVSLPLWDTLRLNASYRDDQQNLDRNPVFRSAPQRKNSRLGFSYRPWQRTKLSLDYWNRTREDRLPDPRFHFSEETVRFTVAHDLKRISLWASAEVGDKQDQFTDQSGRVQQYSLSASWNPRPNQSYRGYLQVSEDDFGGEEWQRITAGLNASVQLSPSTTLGVNLQKSEYKGPMTMGREEVDLEFDHRFRNHHELSLCGRYASYSNSFRENETAVLVGYEIPFGLPVSRKTSTGILKGRVYNAQSPERGIPRAIVRLNEFTAVTDRNGNFTFGSLKPGTYYLTLDRESIGMDCVMVEKSPMGVTIAGGKKSRAEVGVTRSASVTGRVVLYQFVRKLPEGEPAGGEENAMNLPPGDAANTQQPATGAVSTEAADGALVESHGLPNIFVELTNPSETLRRITDGKGRFFFEDVRPGDWTLKIYDAGLPENHYLEQDTFTLELKPGDRKEVFARVLPKKRRIKIIEEGGVLGEK